MAYLLSTGATGNWTSASTWSVADATNFIDSRATSTSLTTTPVANTSFTWASGAPTLQGVAVQLSVRAASPNGTITAELYNVTGASSVRSVTVNVSNLSTTYGAVGSTWTYFKFPSNVTLTTGINYAIRLSTSIASQVFCYSLATTNWSYVLVTTTNQSPTTNDSVIVTGKHTGAGLFTSSVVTMDNTTATQYGNIFISNRGTLQFDTAASTNYALANNGASGTVFIIGYGGTFNIGNYNGGTSPTFIPSTSTATLTLNCSSLLSTPMLVYGTFNTYGPNYQPGSFTSNAMFGKLSADVTAGATASSITANNSTYMVGKIGDLIVVPSTTRTPGQYETITLTSNIPATPTATFSHSAYANAHGGNAATLVQADIANITRNILIKSGSTTFRSNIQVQLNARCSLYCTTFQDLGSGIISTTAGIGVPVLNSANGGIFLFGMNVMTNSVTNSSTLSGTGLLTADTNSQVTNNVFYNLGWTALAGANSIFYLGTNNMIIGNYSSTYACVSTACDANNVFTSNTSTTAALSTSTITYASIYSNSTYGMYYVGTATSGGMYALYIWRNGTGGLAFNNSSTTYPRSTCWDFSYCNIFGNGTYGITIVAALYTRVLFNTCNIYGGSTLVQSYGYYPGVVYSDNVIFSGCFFGYDNTQVNSSPHATANIFTPSRLASTQFQTCQFSGTEIAGQTPQSTGANSYNMTFTSTNHNYSGLNKQWVYNGIISGDNAIYNTTSPSLRMSPISGAYKLCSATIKIPAKANSTVSVSAKVRRSSSNLLTYTEDLTNTIWLSDAPVVTRTGNSTNSPLGTLTATKITESTSSSPQNIYQSLGTTIAGGVYCYSVYIKAAERQYARVTLGTSSVAIGGDIFVDLSSGSVFSSTSYGNGVVQTYLVTNASNGWWRCSIFVLFPTSVAINGGVYIRNNNSGSNANYAGNSGNGIYIWGAMAYSENNGGWSGNPVYPYEAVLSTPIYTPYNGSLPRLMVSANPINSINSDYLLYQGTTTGWETYSGTLTASFDTVWEVYVDCDGTQGWINMDDFSCTPSVDSRGTDFTNSGGMYLEADWRKPGGSYGFVS